ncbi:MAG: PEP-CTERM sorting domain-containing protein [Puniceicoccaceae bacterium]
MKTTSLRLIAGLVALGATAGTANAAVLAYEGFDAPELVGVPGVGAPDGTTLDNVAASGTGFSGGWTVTNGNSLDSIYQAAGLSYPGSYAGTHTAVGGNGLNKGNTSNSFLRLNFDNTAYTNIGGTNSIWVSFLAERQGPTVTEDGILDAATRTADNRVSEYPRNFGARLMNAAGGSNNSAGVIGKGSWWNADGEVYPDVIGGQADTWSFGNFNDLNRVYSGADFANGTDHVVLNITRYNGGAGTWLTMWVNPVTDGSDIVSWDGYSTGAWTDGDPQALDWYGFGVEAGSNSGSRPVGEWVFDEIYVATTFNEATGLTGSPVPEPGTYALIFGILAAVGVFFHRRRKG